MIKFVALELISYIKYQLFLCLAFPRYSKVVFSNKTNIL